MRLATPSSLLGVIDVQDRLLGVIPDADALVARCTLLARAAEILGVRTMLTEQYPQGLGPTPPGLAAALPPAVTKLSFSCCGCTAFEAALGPGIETVLLAGLETHVCVAQTALDLLARGLTVFIAVDAVGSRHAIDHATALRRLESAGAMLTTAEAAVFEWCGSAEHPRFQDLRRLVLSR